MKKHCNTQKIK